MKSLVISFLLLFATICSYGQTDRLSIIIPSPEGECNYVWQNIKDIKFFDSHGYSIYLPSGAFIDELLRKSRNASLTSADYDSLKKSMINTIYHQNDYVKGYQGIIDVTPTIENAIKTISETQFSWNFYQFPKYKIMLTLYGPGGSYDPEIGQILLQTTPDGSFKGYNNPAFTIVHEFIHIGIESSIIKKYNLAHTQKERIVDLFVKTFFNDILIGYKIQGLGDSRIDKYLKNKNDFIELPKRIEQFLSENR